MTIWKYELVLVDEQKIVLPKGGKVLTAQMQDGILCIWVEWKSVNEGEFRRFAIVGTGNACPHQNLQYIATVQNDGFVWHIYEILKPT